MIASESAQFVQGLGGMVPGAWMSQNALSRISAFRVWIVRAMASIQPSRCCRVWEAFSP